MAAEIKAEVQVPDLWFDFYARLIPGTAFVVAVRMFIFEKCEIPEHWVEVGAIFVGGYFVALLTQPISSCLTEKMEKWAQKKKNTIVDIGALERQLGTSSRSTMILAKMHGETTLFLQLAVLAVVYLIVEIAHCREAANCHEWARWVPPVLVAIISPFLACEVANRRLRRVKGYVSALAVQPKDGGP